MFSTYRVAQPEPLCRFLNQLIICLVPDHLFDIMWTQGSIE